MLQFDKLSERKAYESCLEDSLAKLTKTTIIKKSVMHYRVFRTMALTFTEQVILLYFIFEKQKEV